MIIYKKLQIENVFQYWSYYVFNPIIRQIQAKYAVVAWVVLETADLQTSPKCISHSTQRNASLVIFRQSAFLQQMELFLHDSGGPYNFICDDDDEDD